MPNPQLNLATQLLRKLAKDYEAIRSQVSEGYYPTLTGPDFVQTKTKAFLFSRAKEYLAQWTPETVLSVGLQKNEATAPKVSSKLLEKREYWTLEISEGEVGGLRPQQPLALRLSILRNDKVELSILYLSESDKLFTVESNFGCRCNGKRLRLGVAPKLPKSHRIVLGLSCSLTKLNKGLDLYQAIAKFSGSSSSAPDYLLDLRRSGAPLLDLAALSEGNLDLLLHFPTSPLDQKLVRFWMTELGNAPERLSSVSEESLPPFLCGRRDLMKLLPKVSSFDFS